MVTSHVGRSLVKLRPVLKYIPADFDLFILAIYANVPTKIWFAFLPEKLFACLMCICVTSQYRAVQACEMVTVLTETFSEGRAAMACTRGERNKAVAQRVN